MCDTFIATASATENKHTLFAKNSDRPPNEAQYLLNVPAMKHSTGEYVQCTYIRIPQVRETKGILLSQSFWMWGAEMGVNEAGLAIGNEAIFSKIPANKEPALLGMDLLRLALERAIIAKEAVEVIIDLIEQYGQGGNCAKNGEMYYHNTFLIADPREAWVLETIDRDWVARQVEDIYSISNSLTISNRWDIASPGLDEHTQQTKTNINIQKDYSDFLYTTFSNARQRCETTRYKLKMQRNQIEVKTMASILREDGDHSDPSSGLTKANVCIHTGLGPIRISQTTASLIAVLVEGNPLVFATGTSAPCTGIFKPLWVDLPHPHMGPSPTAISDPDTLFWSHERLHRVVERNFHERLGSYSTDRDQLETEFIQGALERMNASTKERSDFSSLCFTRAAEAESEWLQRVLTIPENRTIPHLLHNFAWNRFNKEANLKLN